MEDMEERLNNIYNNISDRIETKPELGLILGSGLGVLVEDFSDPVLIPYEEIPGFPVSTVEGHAGRLVLGSLGGKQVVALQGRFHYYEGYSMQELVIPVRIMGMLGIEKLIVTNAAGGVNLNFSPGEFMFITDHINFMGANPLRGENLEEFGPRFPDMSTLYSQELIETGEDCASGLRLVTRRGVYAGMMGPSFETPAEIRFLRTIGADAVGMSTVPEVIAAGHMGLSVLGISCITNMAAGVLPQPLSHEEVMEISQQVKPEFKALVGKIVNKLV